MLRIKIKSRVERERSDGKVTEEKLTVGTLLKLVVLKVLACLGFFVLWGFLFLLSLPLMNVELSLFLSMLISAITIFALIALIPFRRRKIVASKRQKVGIYVAYAIILAFILPLIKINPVLFLSILPSASAATFILIYYALRSRKGEEKKSCNTG